VIDFGQWTHKGRQSSTMWQYRLWQGINVHRRRHVGKDGTANASIILTNDVITSRLLLLLLNSVINSSLAAVSKL